MRTNLEGALQSGNGQDTEGRESSTEEQATSSQYDHLQPSKKLKTASLPNKLDAAERIQASDASAAKVKKHKTPAHETNQRDDSVLKQRVCDKEAQAAHLAPAQHGPFSREELGTLDHAVKEFAEKHGLSTTNFE
jgi:hypothetical protein